MKPRMLEHSPAREDEDERILPLINVVFLLLIFFMIAGSFTQTDPFEIAPPTSDAPEVIEEPRLVIHLGADGRAALGERYLDLAEVPAALQARGEAPPHRVWVKGDADVEATALIGLIEDLREVGVRRVHLLTIKRAG